MRATYYRLVLAALTLPMANLATATDRLVDYVSPSLLGDAADQSHENSLRNSTAGTAIGTAAKQTRPVSAADRWERFEGEYSVKQLSDSRVLGSLQEAKYQLDKATFTMQEMLLTVEEAFSFDYGWSDLGLPVTSPRSARATNGRTLWDSVQDARLKSDINLNVASESFVGVRLVLPLGD